MKTETFVQLNIDTWHPNGSIYGELTLINMSYVLKIVRDKNRCRLVLKDGTSLLCAESYEDTIKRIESQS